MLFNKVIHCLQRRESCSATGWFMLFSLRRCKLKYFQSVGLIWENPASFSSLTIPKKVCPDRTFRPVVFWFGPIVITRGCDIIPMKLQSLTNYQCLLPARWLLSEWNVDACPTQPSDVTQYSWCIFQLCTNRGGSWASNKRWNNTWLFWKLHACHHADNAA